jgi:hypothetical protein
MDSTLDCTKTDVRFYFFMTKSVHVILAHFEVRFALAENKKETEEEEEEEKLQHINCRENISANFSPNLTSVSSIVQTRRYFKIPCSSIP